MMCLSEILRAFVKRALQRAWGITFEKRDLTIQITLFALF